MIHVVSKLPVAAALAIAAGWTPTPALSPDFTPPGRVIRTAMPADYFQFPLPAWEPHCLGFGSDMAIEA